MRGALERARHRVDRAHEQLPPRIHRRDGVAPDERERPVAERLGLVLGHQQDGRGAVGQGRRVARRHRAVPAVEDRPELRQGLERGVGTNEVVGVVTSSMPAPPNHGAISAVRRPSSVAAAAPADGSGARSGPARRG